MLLGQPQQTPPVLSRGLRLVALAGPKRATLRRTATQLPGLAASGVSRALTPKFSPVEPAIRGILSLSPEERLSLALEALDWGWEMGLAGEMAAGASTRDEAEQRLGRRWRKEDALRLQQKLERWRTLERARRQDS